MTQEERTETFHHLHHQDTPLNFNNIWDAGSAKQVAENGAKALATGSWSVAAAHGYEDGEFLPLPLVIANLERIVQAVDIPVSLDIEKGYGTTGQEVYETIKQVVEAGAVGINIEDSVSGKSDLRAIPEQCDRIKAAVSAAADLGQKLFVNARVDVYFQDDLKSKPQQALEEVLKRATAYEEAGASGLFVPGLLDLETIRSICSGTSLPVNIMVKDHELSVEELAEVGVRRISQGPGPYLRAMASLTAD